MLIIYSSVVKSFEFNVDSLLSGWLLVHFIVNDRTVQSVLTW